MEAARLALHCGPEDMRGKSKVVPVLIKQYAMKAYGGVNVWIHIFYISALVGIEWSASRPGRFTPGTHWIGG
jgi:hypothetical protein